MCYCAYKYYIPQVYQVCMRLAQHVRWYISLKYSLLFTSPSSADPPYTGLDLGQHWSAVVLVHNGARRSSTDTVLNGEMRHSSFQFLPIVVNQWHLYRLITSLKWLSIYREILLRFECYNIALKNWCGMVFEKKMAWFVVYFRRSYFLIIMQILNTELCLDYFLSRTAKCLASYVFRCYETAFKDIYHNISTHAYLNQWPIYGNKWRLHKTYRWV